ncbi:MmcQ/YjbR family DNA-binding protein [Thomasclavelia sp.]
MKVENIFECYFINEEALINYGFTKIEDEYYLKKDLENNNFYVRFIITNNIFDVRVFDANDEEYLPFYIKNAIGSFNVKIKKEVEWLIKDVINNCFDFTSIKEELLLYIKQKYNTMPEYPWKKDPASATLKTQTNKWYGLIMNIPYKYLKIEKEGKIDVLNVKNTPEKIKNLIDFKHYFPAYHMNKKYWISILLDRTIELSTVTKLLDESYEIVNRIK